jgi:transposase
MVDLALSRHERAALADLAAHTDDARVLRRAQALLWLDADEGIQPIAERLGVSRQTIYNWTTRFQLRDEMDLVQRLADAPREGRPRTVQGVIDPLIDAVIERDPRSLGYRATAWTAPLLVEYLREAHQIEVGCTSVRAAIERLRIRWKRPRHTLALRPATWRQVKGG